MKPALRAALTLSILAAVLALGTAPVSAAPETYEVDLSHSFAMFRIKHLNVGYAYGRFNDFAGTFVVDEANPAASSVELTIQVKSVDTNNEKRDQHLRSPDFFSANQFPTMVFKSTAVSKSGEGAYEVKGNLTLHGVTKPVTLAMRKTGKGDDPWGNHRIGFEGTTSIKRSDFGMNKMMEAVADQVWITVAVEGIRK
jgi:polyisoprenoid-binding protein YceI